MRILVLQHAAAEHIGAFGPLLRNAGHDLLPRIAQDGVGSLDGIEAMWVMGGPMQVWQAPELPWLAEEIEFVRHAVVDRGLPYFGVCLGHQILATALGGTVGPAKRPEIGQMNVQAAEGFETLFGLGGDIPCFQWHSAEVTVPPTNAQVLASSANCAVQAMRWGQNAMSVQFHAELDEATFHDWCTNPAVVDELVSEVGTEAAQRAKDDLKAAQPGMDKVRKALVDGWLESISRL